MESTVTATLDRSALLRLTRGMSPIEKAAFLGLETNFPLPVQVGLFSYHVESLRHPGETHTVDVQHKTCDCPAGQAGRDCFHRHLVGRLRMFGPYRTALREQDTSTRYERSTGDAPRNLPEPYMSPEQWRAYARREA